jgi:hypothetical protein
MALRHKWSLTIQQMICRASVSDHQMETRNDKMENQMKTITTMTYSALAMLACFVLYPKAEAVVPAPDGGYPGGNTAEGQNALLSLTSGTYNTAVGWASLQSNTTGRFNTGVGAGALLANTSIENTATGAGALLSNTTGYDNTANGAFALFSDTTGSQNTANGANALRNNTTGSANTAIGDGALFQNTIGIGNTATGLGALLGNSTGNYNTATGEGALLDNFTGSNNTAAGSSALQNNSGGANNSANGYQALQSNTSGNRNNAFGAFALQSHATRNQNNAFGSEALGSDQSGELNSAFGDGALFSNVDGSRNTAVGGNALGVSAGDDNIALGSGAGINLLTGSNNIYIGDAGPPGFSESNVIAIGANPPSGTPYTTTLIGGIFGQSVDPSDATPVFIDSAGKLGTVISSRRFKRDIKPMDKASEAILSLKPVTFHYKSDSKSTPCFGLVAEDVEQVNPDLVIRDKNGELLSVRYEAVNAMLLNEFLKEHRNVDEQQATIAELKSTVVLQRRDFQATAAQQQKEIQVLTAQLKGQAAEIQKVSDQIEIKKRATRVLLNQP